ncbi:MAG: glycosyltransferase [Candidatus Levybacteria bacterium]|nr:glycosyltransferase [Candidatus Levybacteria bacterium]
MGKLYLSVVIPSFNEMVNLRKGVLDRVERFLESRKIEYEVIIVDDGSTDGSIEFAEKFIKENPPFKLIKNPHLGKAGTVTTGMLAAEGQYVLFADMDQATPIEELDNLLPFVQKGFDVVIGSRSSKRKGAPWTRLLMAKGMIFLRTAIVGLSGISDTQCGFKLFTQEAARTLFSRIEKIHHGFHRVSGSSVSAGFDVELLYLARKLGYKIKEVPVEWLYVETRRVSPVKDSVEGLIDLFRIKISSISGKYK